MDGEFRPICPPPRGLVRPTRALPDNLTGPRPGQVRSRHWRQTTHGYWVPATVDDDLPEQRILEQSLRLPDGGVVTGWAGCRLARAAYFDGRERDGTTGQPVPLLVPRESKLRSLPGSVISREPVGPGDTRVVAQIPTASPVRSLFDEMRRVEDPREAVVAVDMMAAALQVSIAELRRYHAARRRWRRSGRVAWAVDLASERSLSPGETRMRLTWVLDARLPHPLVNQPVFDTCDRLVCVADLFDPSAGVVVEYDGATHLRRRRRSRDIEREERCRRAGLEYVAVTGVDDSEKVVERMVTARQRAPGLRGVKDQWTLDEPPWWHGETAEDHLAYRDWRRSNPGRG